jgi:hypothetical protein
MVGTVGVLMKLFNGACRSCFEGFRCHKRFLCARLLEIAFDETNEFICSLCFWRVGFDLLTQHMTANMPLYDLGHEPIKGPAAGREQLQDGGTLMLFLKGFTQRVHLPPNSIHAFKELVFVSSSVGHRSSYSIPPYIIKHVIRRGMWESTSSCVA